MAKQTLNQQALASQKSSQVATTEGALKSAIALYQQGSTNKDTNAQNEAFFLQMIVNNNDKLKGCSGDELVKVFLGAATLGLTFNPAYQFVHVVPYWNSQRGVSIPNMQIGYKGMEYLMCKSGLLKKVIATDLVYEGEEYTSSLDMGEVAIVHKKSPFNRSVNKGEIGGYIFVELYNGQKKLLELSTADFNYARSKSKSWGNTPEKQAESLWATNRPAMCKKTLWRRLYSDLIAHLKIAQERTEGEAKQFLESMGDAMQMDMEQDLKDGPYEYTGSQIVVEQVVDTKQDVKSAITQDEPADTEPEDNDDVQVEQAEQTEEQFEQFKKTIIAAYEEAGIGLAVIKHALKLERNDKISREQLDKLDEVYAPYIINGDKVALNERLMRLLN